MSTNFVVRLSDAAGVNIGRMLGKLPQGIPEERVVAMTGLDGKPKAYFLAPNATPEDIEIFGKLIEEAERNGNVSDVS